MLIGRIKLELSLELVTDSEWTGRQRVVVVVVLVVVHVRHLTVWIWPRLGPSGICFRKENNTRLCRCPGRPATPAEMALEVDDLQDMRRVILWRWDNTGGVAIGCGRGPGRWN